MLLSAKNWTTLNCYCMVCLPISWISYTELIQNTAARVVSFARKYDHITPVLLNLHWLPVRLIFKILFLVDQTRNGLAPSCLSDMLRYRMSKRKLRSTARNFLAVSRTYTKSFGDRAFSVAGSKLWDQLPLSIRQSSTVGTFTKELKTHLFKLA